jgi:predicted nucleic acid-binding Zn ribbon protein
MATRKYRNLRQSLRDRQTSLARRVGPKPKPVPRKTSAWTVLFALPDLEAAPVGHPGRCNLCGNPVDALEKRCSHCGGIWRVAEKSPYRRRNYLFGIASMAIAIGVGFLCHLLFARHVVAAVMAGDFARGSDPAMWTVFDSFLWIFATVLTLIAATFLFERLHKIAPHGTWVKPERSVDRR